MRRTVQRLSPFGELPPRADGAVAVFAPPNLFEVGFWGGDKRTQRNIFITVKEEER